MSVWMPGAVNDPGTNADYAAGRNRMEIAVEHFTVGTNSYGIGKRGYFHFLFPKAGAPWQFAEIDAITWHAGPFNPNGPGAEFERLGYEEPLTPDQVFWGGRYHQWLHDDHGFPLEHYEGPRFQAISSGFRGFVNHGDLDDQRSDGVTTAEFVAMVGASPKDEEEDEVLYIAKKSDPGLGIWATGGEWKRHVNPDEWAFVQFVSPGRTPLQLTDQWWASIPEAK